MSNPNNLFGTDLVKKVAGAKKDLGAETMELINQKVTPEAIANALCEALQADVWSKEGGKGPDHRIRLEAIKVYLNWQIGKPVERSITITQPSEDDDQIMERMLQSPAAVAALERKIAKAKKAFPVVIDA
jgi:hypothetical protein